jgi:hypothetical protein
MSGGVTTSMWAPGLRMMTVRGRGALRTPDRGRWA